MLITMLTAMYVMVRVVESIGSRFARQEDPVPYMVSQPLPWQVHSVSHSRRSSKAEEKKKKKKQRVGLTEKVMVSPRAERRHAAKVTVKFDGLRRNSIGVYRKNSNIGNGTCAVPDVPAAPPLSPVEVEKAATTIQSHFRKFQQKKQKNGN